MIRFIILLVIISMVLSLSAKDKKNVNIPNQVKDALTKLYPDAKDVKWDKEGKNYEAGFDNKGTKTSVNIDKTGKLIETEVNLKISELPKGIEEFVAKNFKGFKITEAAKIVDSKGIIAYETEVTKGNTRKDMMFDKDGKLLKNKFDLD